MDSVTLKPLNSTGMVAGMIFVKHSSFSCSSTIRETNLKVRQSLEQTQSIGDDLDQLVDFNGANEHLHRRGKRLNPMYSRRIRVRGT